MIRDIKLGIGRILIIDPLPPAWLVPNETIRQSINLRVINLVQTARAKYDAVILLESAHYAVEFYTKRLGYNLNSVPSPWRKMIRQCGFIPVVADVHDEADFGRSYWLLEFEGQTKAIKKRTPEKEPTK